MKTNLAKLLLVTAAWAASAFLARPSARPAEDLQGAWQLRQGNQTSVMIVTGQHFVIADFDLAGKKFVSASGGTYSFKGGQLNQTWEFFTADSTVVGITTTVDAQLKGAKFTLGGFRNAQRVDQAWQRIDDGQGTPLVGIWRITGRQGNNGQVSTIQRGARKTIKVLSGTRFMWAAINPETKQFFGCGGGTYTAQNGQYVETLEFFSRDNTRVGSNLTFDFEVKGRDWHHRGKSSKGDPIYEIWSRDE
ncbi:MAG: membrane or secreted protein [Bernardetiaceae bacterium]|jgi:hypothetical protein|nr:membrane or secreted protein [Bernardetiaceae bacterium]